jgi:nitrous oxidase accessory protein NosD
VNNNGHRIRAAEPGAAVFGAGLVIGGSATAHDALIQGLAFDLSDRQKTLEGAAINVWGGATGARILDVTVEGHGTLAAALIARQPEGLVVQRVRARGFTDYGMFVDANATGRQVIRPALIEDILVTDVGRAQPRSSNGTAEACLWVGNTATVRRAVLRTCAWTGVWTGTATSGSVLEDLTIDDTPVGVYIEHFTTGSLFQRLRIGPRVHTGIACEWADPQWGGRPACVDDLIQDSTIDSCAIGVTMGSGTTRTTVRSVTFIGQRVAALIDTAGVENTFGENDYTAIGDGAVPIATGTQAAATGTTGDSMTCSGWAWNQDRQPR